MSFTCHGFPTTIAADNGLIGIKEGYQGCSKGSQEAALPAK